MARRPTKSSFETEVEVNGVPTPVTVEYSYYPGHPGRISGPPEDCEPPEGPEVEVLALYATDDKAKTDLSEKVSKPAMAQLEEQCCFEAEDSEDSRYEAAMESKFDAMHEGD